MIRPFLALMTRSELHAVLTCGFATIGGEYLVAFIPLGVSLHSLGYNVVPWYSLNNWQTNLAYFTNFIWRKYNQK